jgi:energy-coupling factor transport system ATP-binding protein
METNTGNSCIEIRDLHFQYPMASEPTLNGVNLSIREGEYVVITGPTGSGKTTLALCLNGIIPHLLEGEMGGDVLVKGLNTYENPVHSLTSYIGMVFQNPEDQLFSLNVEDEVAFGVENMGYSRQEIIERVEYAIQTAGLTHRRNYSIFHLSGGQKQKVAIASNLAIEPDIFVLDAPTADLDPISSAEVVRTLIDLRRKIANKTFIVIDSNISHVMNLADRIVLLDKGQIVLDGSPVEVLRDHYQKLVEVGIRVPDHIRLMHYLVEKFPHQVEFSLEEKRVKEIFAERLSKGQMSYHAISHNGKGKEKPEPIVRFEEVSFNFLNGPVILDHQDLEIQKGECLAIIGENGTGKSTLMKLVCGLLQPVSGKIHTLGVDTSSKEIDSALKRIGYLFQNPDNQLFMGTLEDEIAFGPRRQGCSEEEVEARLAQALETVGLTELRKVHPFTLSRGQRQRLAVATVLAARPELLLLDEPTTGQDQIALDSLMQHTQRLIQEHGATVIMVTHDMDLVAQHATRVIVLSEGKVILDGPPRTVFTKGRALLESVKLTPPGILNLTDCLGEENCLDTLQKLLDGLVVNEPGVKEMHG